MPNDNTIQVFTNNKCTQSILYQKFVYRFFRSNRKSGNIVWRCVQKTCSVTVTTNPGIDTLLKQSRNTHGHRANKVDVVLKELRWTAKREARANRTERPLRYLVDQLLRSVQAYQCVVHAMRQMMYRERRKGRLQVPEVSLAETVRQLQQGDIALKDGQLFVHVPVCTGLLVAVTCATNLKFLLNDTDAVFVDFTSAPGDAARFPRAYTVYGIAGSRCVPLAYLFVPPEQGARSDPDTGRVCMALDELCRELADGPFAPARLLLADLSPASHALVAGACPGTAVVAARFHVLRAWDARIRNDPALRDAYGDPTAPSGFWLRSFFGLSRLPPGMVPDAYVALMAECPKRRPFNTFADFVLDNYIEGDGGFAPHQWAQRPGGCSANDVVSYFNRVKQGYRVPLSDIFLSIDLLKQKQKATDSAIRLITEMGQDDGCSCEIDKNTYFITHVYGRLIANEINMTNYLRTVGNKITQTF